jgi:hypothetical protein
MNKWVLMILLTVISFSAMADWIEFGHNPDFTGYVDSVRVSRAGNLVRVTSLIDYKAAKTDAGRTFLSVKAQHEFNCTEAQVRKFYLAEYSGSMGKGEIVRVSYKIDDFEPIQPFSILEQLWKAACE